MRDISSIPAASKELLEGDEYDPSDEPDDKKVLLAQKLESEGKTVICVGRGLITIERSDYEDEIKGVGSGWGTLKVSTYSDPDVSCEEVPDSAIYLKVGRYGLSSLQLEQGDILQSLLTRSS